MRYFIFVLAIAAGCSHYSPEISDALTAIQIQDRNGFTETISSPERLANYLDMDFLASQPFKKVLRVYRNKGKSHSIITAYHPNGGIAQYLETKEMRASGVYREWFPNGQLKIDAYVIGGTADITKVGQKDWLFDGVSQVWDEDGHLIAEIPYKQGNLQGTSIYFYQGGNQKCLIPYIKNMEEGERIEFFPSGNVRARAWYVKGHQDGKSLGFFDNKRTAWEEVYRDELLLQGIYYDPNGEQIALVEDGRGVQARYDGERVAFLLEIRQGVPEGLVKKFHKQGDLVASYTIRNGKKHGREVAYYAPRSGETERKEKLSIQWDHGMIHGIVKTWYRNGQLQSQREYARNQKLGPNCAWYKNGSLMLVEEYEDGSITKGAYYKKNQDRPVSTITNGNGTAYLYDEEGAFMKKIQYAKGKPTDPED